MRLLLLTVILLLVYPVSANSFIEDMGLAIGIYHNEFTVSNETVLNSSLTPQVEVNSTFDSDIIWAVNGLELKQDTKIRNSKVVIDDNFFKNIPKSKNPNEIIEYKAGRNPKTQKMRYQLTAIYGDNQTSWIIE